MDRRRVGARLAVLAAVVAALALVLAMGLVRPRGDSPPATPAPAKPAAPAAVAQYVGSQACQRCHAAEHQAWQASQHRQAMLPAARDTVLAPFAGERFGSSRFSQREGRFVAQVDGADGRPTEVEVSHTIGIAPLQQYLVRRPDGGLQVLDIAWDSRPRDAGGQRWFALQQPRPRPGDALHWSGPSHNASLHCVECHVTAYEKRYDADTRRYDSRWAEAGVGCEACHGPGSRHLAWAGGVPAPPPDERKGLTLPRPDGRAELALCARCHAHRSTIADLPAAGAPLLDSHRPSLLRPDLYFSDGQMRAEVYTHGSFLQSRMAARGVRCGDCHEPHGQRLRAAGNAVCARCHDPQRFAQREHLRHASGSGGAQCVACHMPTRTFMRIDARHEHAIRVPRPDLSLRLGTPNACSQCHGDRGLAWAARWARRWYPTLGQRPQPLAEALHASDTGQASATALLLDLLRDAQCPAFERASALARLPLAAVPAATLEAALTSPDDLLRHTAVEALQQAPAAVREARLPPLLADPVRAVRIAAARALATVGPARLTASDRQALQRALDEYRAAQRHEAERPEAWNNLGTLQADLGDLAGAEQALQQALALAPDFAATTLNLADVHRAQGREPEAEALLRQLLARQPRLAVAWHALGLSLLRQQRAAEALPALRQASALAPHSPRYAQVLAMALVAQGRRDEALAVPSAALRRHPVDATLQQVLLGLER